MYLHDPASPTPRAARPATTHASGVLWAPQGGWASAAGSLKRLMDQHGSAALCLVHLDASGLQRVQELVGSDSGEMVLAELVSRAARASQAGPWIALMVARVGRHEFVALFGADSAHLGVDDLLKVMGRPIDGAVLGSDALLTLGCAFAPPGQPTDLVANARAALEVARLRGPGSGLVFDPSRTELYCRTERMEGLLATAIKTRVGLSIDYQPVVARADVPGGPGYTLHAVEALARWRCAELGKVSPAEFIPVAESAGLISPLGRQVMDGACNFFKVLERLPGAPVLLSVNVSAAQLTHMGVVADFVGIVRTAGLWPKQVQLEITESIAVRGLRARDLLCAFKAAGFRIALDDFGTGYSSLAYLNELPIDTVKIDRSFVSEMESSPYHRAIVESTIRLAAVLGLDTTAEGVETEFQAEVLTELGCKHLQGSLFSMPLSEPAMRLWLAGVALRGLQTGKDPHTDRNGQV